MINTEFKKLKCTKFNSNEDISTNIIRITHYYIYIHMYDQLKHIQIVSLHTPLSDEISNTIHVTINERGYCYTAEGSFAVAMFLISNLASCSAETFSTMLKPIRSFLVMIPRTLLEESTTVRCRRPRVRNMM